MPPGLVAMVRSGGHCPLRVSGGILCSERGQSRDAFQAIPLEETSPRCNKMHYTVIFKIDLVWAGLEKTILSIQTSFIFYLPQTIETSVISGCVFSRIKRTGIIVVLTSKSALELISTTPLFRSQVYSLQ